MERPQAPETPTGLSVTPGDGQATVTWRAPASSGGHPITGYIVRVLKDGAVLLARSTPELAITLTGLTNGDAYTFTVSAANALGEGPPSVTPAAVRPRSIPGAPREVTVTPGNRQATVRWSAPETAGMPITGYTVTVHDAETIVALQDTPGTSLDITGLTNGKAYTVTVTASNAVTAGAASGPVAVTPRSVPGAPRVTVASNINRILLDWTLADDGGSPVTGYTVTVRSGDTLVSTHQTADTRIFVWGLTQGATYTFTVVATNAVGDGEVSEPALARQITVAGAPINLRTTLIDGGVIFDWDPPLNDGGSPVLGYRVSTLMNGNWTEWLADQPPVTVTGLTHGVRYRFSVEARTDADYGDSVVTELQPAALPGPPRNLRAYVDEYGILRLYWDPPADTGGSGVDVDYRLQVEPGSEVWEPSTERFALYTPARDTTYTITLASKNQRGLSTSTIQFQFTTPP